MSTPETGRSDVESSATTCHRHPRRDAYVRCIRCDRYACPDCLHEAAVGHQCGDCVKEGRKSVRAPRTVFGGAVSAVPVVTYVLIALNVAAYVATLLVPGMYDALSGLGRGLRGPGGEPYLYAEPAFGLEKVGVAYGEWYRLVTSNFLHLLPDDRAFGIAHILGNMLVLWFVGRGVEAELGKVRYTVVYLLSGVGGCVFEYLLAPDVPVVGASGALFGLGAAYVVIARRRGGGAHDANRMLLFLLVWLVVTAKFASWQGHLGGLLTGGALMLAFAAAPRDRRTAVHIAASAAALALLVGLTALQTAALT